MKEKCVHESFEAQDACPSKRRRPMPRHDREDEVGPEEPTGTPQWLFRRGDFPEMMISEHLGDTSSMVESLTHEVKSWSLISSSKKLPETTKHQPRVHSTNRALMKILLRDTRKNKEQGGGGEGYNNTIK